MAQPWTHLIRFIAEEDGQIHLGNVDAKKYPDIGLSTLNGEKIQANLATGSIFDAKVTSTVLTVKQLLGPIAAHEVPLVRCIGLNYRDHAREANMPIPAEPVLFIKPRTAINGPFPAKINVPKISQDGTADYEAELTVIIGKDGRDIPVEEALDYVLGYTCGNDVSARAQQFKNSQWCFSKGEWSAFFAFSSIFLAVGGCTRRERARGAFWLIYPLGLDGSAPLGPVLVSPAAAGDVKNLSIKAIHNSNVVQDSNTR